MSVKTFLLVCEGMADDPLEELGGRTPLEVAKTPFMDELAKNGKSGCAAFTPHSLPAASDVAMFSLLGYDPQEFYTGIAPLEAIAAGITQSDTEIAFRCDMVTIAEEAMVDTTAGRISPDEAGILLKEVKAKLENRHFKFHALSGYKNIAIVHGPDKVEDWDELECSPPAVVLGQKTAKWLPKGKMQQELCDWMNASKPVLENHEVNRVRIDLMENPADHLWFWGQGKKPKLQSFKQRFGLEGALHADALFMKGLGKALDLKIIDDLSKAAWKDLNVIYAGTEDDPEADVLKAKIRRIEQFDAKVVGLVLGMLKRSGQSARVAVASNVVHSLIKKANTHTHAPFVVSGPGIEAGGSPAFTEKNCAQSGVLLEAGHTFLNTFLKN